MDKRLDAILWVCSIIIGVQVGTIITSRLFLAVFPVICGQCWQDGVMSRNGLGDQECWRCRRHLTHYSLDIIGRRHLIVQARHH